MVARTHVRHHLVARTYASLWVCFVHLFDTSAIRGPSSLLVLRTVHRFANLHILLIHFVRLLVLDKFP